MSLSLPLIRSTEVYKLMRRGLGSRMKSLGFKRTKSSVGWCKELDDGFIALSFRLNYGFCQYRGGDFVLSLRVSESEAAKKGATIEKNLISLLDDADMDTARKIQNVAISRCIVPTGPYYLSEGMRGYYEEAKIPVRDDEEIGYFRFTAESDIETWCKFIEERLERFLDELLTQWKTDHPDAKKITVNSVEYEPWQELLDDSENDEPRLVYADFLDDQGDEARGEFIRIDCQLHRMIQEDEGFQELNRKRAKLFHENSDDWVAGFGKLPITRPVFERGFVKEVTMTAKQLIKRGAEVAEKIPFLDSVTIKSATKVFPELSEFDLPDKIKRISFAQTKVYFQEAETVWPAFLDSPCTKSVSGLGIRGADIYGPALRRIAESQLIERLEFLDVANSGLHDSMGQFFEDFRGENLRELDISMNRISSFDAELIANCPALSKLERLDISSNTIGGKGLVHLAKSSILKKLKVLTIRDNRVTAAAMLELANPENLPSLELLQWWDVNVSDDVIKEISKRCRVTKGRDTLMW